jgi:hypothetical protein
MQVFAGPLSGGRRAVAWVNKQPLGSAVNMTLSWSKIGYPSSLKVQVKDAFTGTVLRAAAQSNITLELPPDDIVMVILKPLPDQICKVEEHLSASEAVRELGQWTRKQLQPAGGEHSMNNGDESCVRLSELEIWRPWHHGFFDIAM